MLFPRPWSSRHPLTDRCRSRRARIYKCKTLEPLAVLSHHRTSLQAAAFAPLSPAAPSTTFSDGRAEDDSEDEGEGEGGRARSGRAWLATGGQEAKIALWEVYPPKAGSKAGKGV